MTGVGTKHTAGVVHGDAFKAPESRWILDIGFRKTDECEQAIRVHHRVLLEIIITNVANIKKEGSVKVDIQ